MTRPAIDLLVTESSEDGRFHKRRTVAAFRNHFGFSPRSVDTCPRCNVGSYIAGGYYERVKTEDEARKVLARGWLPIYVDYDLPESCW